MIPEYCLAFHCIGEQLYSIGLSQQLATQFCRVLHFPHVRWGGVWVGVEFICSFPKGNTWWWAALSHQGSKVYPEKYSPPTCVSSGRSCVTLVNNLRKLVQWATSDLMWTEKGVLRTPNEQVPLLGPTAQLYAHGSFYYPHGVTDTKIVYMWVIVAISLKFASSCV